MSKARSRKPRTDATRQIKNKRVIKSSHGKFSSVIELEAHRVAETEKNKKNKKR